MYLLIFSVAKGGKEHYDAFICINLDNSELHNVNSRFAHKLIDRLETNGDLKLCVPNRDDLPGAAMYEEYSLLIKER